MRHWFVYLLRCGDGTLYCGVTTDLGRRLSKHNAGTGARYTASRLPVEMVAGVPFPDRSSALRAEAAVKRRPRDKKLTFLLSLGMAAEVSL